MSKTFPAEDYVSRAAQMAFAIGDSVYDCIYLALCEQQKLTLITADNSLIGNIRDTEFEYLGKKLA